MSPCFIHLILQSPLPVAALYRNVNREKNNLSLNPKYGFTKCLSDRATSPTRLNNRVNVKAIPEWNLIRILISEIMPLLMLLIHLSYRLSLLMPEYFPRYCRR